jgi:hypothetical protein
MSFIGLIPCTHVGSVLYVRAERVPVRVPVWAKREERRAKRGAT